MTNEPEPDVDATDAIVPPADAELRIIEMTALIRARRGEETSLPGMLVALLCSEARKVGKAAAERDALAAKLEKAMAVVNEVLEPLDPYTACQLCTPFQPNDGGDWIHGDDCPLVNSGFIDRDGRRLETAGKEGK